MALTQNLLTTVMLLVASVYIYTFKGQSNNTTELNHDLLIDIKLFKELK